MTTGSESDIASRAARVLPAGATHAARAYTPSIYVTGAQGSRKWLLDGRELVDFTMGHGALLLGHAHPAVVAAVSGQAARGTHYGAGHPLEVEWAELICALVESVEMVRFTASGTEAAMLALRVARAASGRDVIVKLDDHFDGWSDAVSLNLRDGEPTVPPGVPRAQLESTRVVADRDLDALRAALAPGDVAAVILEASGAHYGRVPLPDGFVAGVREACTAANTLLVIDEVVTGFRVCPAGIQATLGVKPDLTLFGKVMAGGLPGGAVGGRRDLMEQIATRIDHPGTFNANPLSAAAGIATLRLCSDGSVQDAAIEVAVAIESGWNHVLARRRVAGRVIRLASILHVLLDDGHRQALLGDAMRANGVDLLRTAAFCSTAHTEEDVALTVAALDSALST